MTMQNSQSLYREMCDMRLHFLFDLCDKITTHIHAQVFLSFFALYFAVSGSLFSLFFLTSHSTAASQIEFSNQITHITFSPSSNPHTHILQPTTAFIESILWFANTRTIYHSSMNVVSSGNNAMNSERKGKNCQKVQRNKMHIKSWAHARAQIGKCLCKMGMLFIEFDSFNKRNENDMVLQ